MAALIKAGRLELVPPAAPGFSPVANLEEVIMRMRKVITGEQVAQLYNRDPFALPIWRAPVYQTPFGIILLVKLARLLAWLIRLAVRHPAASSVVAVLALTWINTGWVGLAALAAWVLVVLASWRFFWPSSFTRWISGPARGKWRAWWCYRRRWAGVMAISGVAPWYQGRILLPVLGKVTATRYTDRVQVRLVSGQSAADVAKRAENLAHGFGAMLCRVRTARSGAVVLEFVRRDALALIVPALPVPDASRPQSPAGRQAGGRAALAGQAARHPCAGRGRHRGRESLAAVGTDPGHVPADASRAGPGAGRRPEADGAGLRPGHLRPVRLLRRRPRTPSPSCWTRPSPTCKPGRPGSPGCSVTTPPRARIRSRWCWSMRSRS